MHVCAVSQKGPELSICTCVFVFQKTVKCLGAATEVQSYDHRLDSKIHTEQDCVAFSFNTSTHSFTGQDRDAQGRTEATFYTTDDPILTKLILLAKYSLCFFVFFTAQSCER